MECCTSLNVAEFLSEEGDSMSERQYDLKWKRMCLSSGFANSWITALQSTLWSSVEFCYANQYLYKIYIRTVPGLVLLRQMILFFLQVFRREKNP